VAKQRRQRNKVGYGLDPSMDWIGSDYCDPVVSLTSVLY